MTNEYNKTPLDREFFTIYQLHLLSYMDMCSNALENGEWLPHPPIPPEDFRKRDLRVCYTSEEKWCEVFGLLHQMNFNHGSQQSLIQRAADNAAYNLLQNVSPDSRIPGLLFLDLLRMAFRFHASVHFVITPRGWDEEIKSYGRDYGSRIRWEGEQDPNEYEIHVIVSSAAQEFLKNVSETIRNTLIRLSKGYGFSQEVSVSPVAESTVVGVGVQSYYQIFKMEKAHVEA